jgi:glutaredoxin
MAKKVIYYHAGCPVCQEAEREVVNALDKAKFQVEVVHLGQAKARIAEAEEYGVKSVPALVIDGKPFHINFGASIADLKK